MSVVKVILKKDITNFGEEGDVKKVKRGYARNFLLPTGVAVEYSAHNKQILDAQKEKIENKRLQKKENANELSKKLELVKVELKIPAGDKGRLYGTVTNSAIADELIKMGFDLDKRQVDLKEHIKYGGSYKYQVHLYQNIYANMILEVIPVQEEKKAPVRGKGRRSRRDEEFDSEVSVDDHSNSEDLNTSNDE